MADKCVGILADLGGPKIRIESFRDGRTTLVEGERFALDTEHPPGEGTREVVGVAYKDRPEAAARFLEELGNPFSAVALDPEGRFGLELGLVGVPETFVVDANGDVRAVHRGPLTPEVVERTIMPALEAGEGS